MKDDLIPEDLALSTLVDLHEIIGATPVTDSVPMIIAGPGH